MLVYLFLFISSLISIYKLKYKAEKEKNWIEKWIKGMFMIKASFCPYLLFLCHKSCWECLYDDLPHHTWILFVSLPPAISIFPFLTPPQNPALLQTLK